MKAPTVICQQILSILALMICLLKILLKSASKSFFLHWRRNPSGFGATISDAVARSSIVFCNSVSADRIVNGCVQGCFVLWLHSYYYCLLEWLHEGCDMDLLADFSPFLALVIFLLKILLKNTSKSFFFALTARSGFGATSSDAGARSSIVFCNSVSAGRVVMAASRLLRAVAAFVILLFFCSWIS